MVRSIIKKEWIKLKRYIYALLFIMIFSIGYFWFNLDFSFSTIEPESMMWYRFAKLGDKPYGSFLYLFIAMGVAISLAQFLPEMIKNRIKILTHLPQKPYIILFLHLAIGLLFVVFLSVLLTTCLSIVIGVYYPSIAIGALFKDSFIYTFLGLVSYLFISAVVIDKKPFIGFIKFILLFLFYMAFFKEQYFWFDIFWIFILVFIPFIVLDSFYSIKQQRLEVLHFRIPLFIFVAVLIVGAYLNYKQNYKKDFDRYYIFYSNLYDEFVYQKNFGDHQFEYGIKDKKTFTQKEYESYLPFVYWRNLDIQKKLPVVIGTKEYTKNMIKNSRLSFFYSPEFLKSMDLKLYPLFNPQSNKGMIRFPEQMFSPNANSIAIYSYDEGLDKKLSDELNALLKNLDLKYPIKNIWGKTTNMKPYDKGYILQDSDGKLFNLKRVDDRFKINKIDSPKEIRYIGISENKQKKFSGYAIGKDSSFYLLTWDFKFIKLELEGFNYKTMKLKLISNPINYLVRFDDGEKYNAVVFDKELNSIKSVKMK